MNHNERRAALSAFIWTIIVMSITGSLVLWQSDVIHAVPVAEANTSVTAYQEALNTANTRLVDAGNRITALEQELAQAKQQSTSNAQDATTTQAGIDAQTAIQIAAQVAGRLQPVADPELVDLDGQPAWSIVYTPGTVYVSQTDGQIMLVERANTGRRTRDDNHDDADDH